MSAKRNVTWPVARLGLLFLATALLVIQGCGRKTPVSAPSDTGVRRQEGMASWYGKGDGYHGTKTASGERFDQNQLTAAHYDLPFGTKVKVTNRKNGRQVTVRINDRFPIEALRKGRIIDLSYRAARVLDMVQNGVVPVTLEVIESPTTVE